MGLELRDKEKEWLVLLLAKKSLGTVSQKVDTILVFVGYRLVVAVPGSAFIRM
jgi:hypothetical protein